jgi:uncharacterized delta-60 repeat protein
LHPGTVDTAWAVVFDSSYNIIIAGSSDAKMIVARYTSAGVLDTGGFNNGVTNGYNLQTLAGSAAVGYGIGFKSTGEIVVGGTDGTHAAVVQFTTAGVLDTSFGVSSSGYNVANSFIGTSAIGYGISIQSDNKIVIGGTTTLGGGSDFVIARYLANGSALDTTFNPILGYKTTDISGFNSTDTGRTLTLQQNGRFIVAGTTSANNGNFATVRYLGDAAPQGCMNVTYNAGGASPGFKNYPTDSNPSNKPQVQSLQALSDSTIYVVTTNLGTTTKSQLTKLNADGTTAIAVVDISPIGAADVIVDSQQRSLVVGTNATPKGWLRRSTSSTSLISDSTFGTSGIVTETTNSTSFRRVGEQKAGRIVVIGQSSTSANGLLIAYNEVGVLATNSQSLCTPFGSSSTGFITMTSATFFDMIIDSNDGIYVAYKGTSGNIKIAKYLANGSALDTANFGSSGIVDTALAIGSYGTPSLTFDASGNIVIAAINSSTAGMVFQRYAPATGSSVTASGAIAQSTNLLTTPILTKLQCDTSNRLVCTGYDNNVFFIARLKLVSTTYSLDATFAPYSSSPGILKTMYDAANPTNLTALTPPYRFSNCVCIAPSGVILFGGYENITNSSTVSVVGQVVSDTATQVSRYPGALLPGVIDTTFGTSGALSLAASPASLSAGQAKAMQVLSNNKILVAVDTGADTVLGQLTSAYALDTASFGSTTGLITLTGLATPKNIMIDVAGNIYVMGDNATPRAVVYKVASDGSSGGTVWATTTLTNGYNVCQQASGRILICGYDSTYNSNAGSGVIVAYTPAGVLDTSFNPGGSVPGYYYTGVAHPITSISVCSSATTADKILIAYESGTSAIVQRLLENGSALDTAFIFGTALTSVSAEDQIRMQIDSNGKIILVARISTGFAARRYTASGANDTGAVTMTLTNPSTASLKNIISLSDGTTLVLGMNTTGNTVEVAQLTLAFALNTSFNASGATPGILQTAISPMIDFSAIDVTPYEGIIVAGDNNATTASANPYMTRIINASTVTKVGQGATATPAAGILDATFYPAGANPGFMNLTTQLATTQFTTSNQAKKLLQLSTGSYFVAADNGTSSYITKMSDDDVQITAFNTTGVVTISSKANLAQMLITQSGELLVVGGSGSSGSNAGWMKLYNATTGAINATFAPTDTLDAIFAVAQGSNGSIIVAGQDNGFGTLLAYNATTGAVDTTFGVNGRYITSYTAAINAMIIDTSGFIYCTVNDNSNLATTIKLSPNAVQVKWTGSTTIANSTNSSNNHIAVDQNGNIVVVAVDTTTPQIVVKRYTSSTGVESATYTLTNGVTSFTTPVVTGLAIDLNATPGKIILIGYNNLATPVPFVLRMLANITSGLDTTFNTTGIQNSNTIGGGTVRSWSDIIINRNGKITVAGYAVISTINTPYLMRVYGDEFIGQYAPLVAAGTPGTLNPNFGDPGFVELATLSGAGALAGQTPQIVVPISNGDYYVAFTDGHLIRLNNNVDLDTTFNTTGFAASSIAGVQSMFIDGSNRLVLAGTTGGAGWLQRYVAGDSGSLDSSCNTAVATALTGATIVTVAIQQTLGRYIVAGYNGTHGALYALSNTGTLDTTFNSQGTVPGKFDTGIANAVYALISDAYDRLIIAYKNGTGIDIVRLTSAGQVDTTFGSNGTISGAIANADDATQVRVTFDVSGNIVVAAHFNDGANKIAVKAYANATGTTVVETQLNITTLTAATLTGMIATADGNVLLSGNQSGSNDMWVARVNNNSGAYQLDSTFGTSGILQFANDMAGTVTARNVTSISIYPDGEIVTVGTETDTANSPNINPFISMAYDTPFTTQIAICQDSKTIGTNDVTLGASSTTATAKGVVFYASATAAANSGQVARAIALQDSANICVAVDGGLSSGSATPSDIFLKMFNIDGTPQTTFGTSGQQTVLTRYANQYVNDMVTFTTPAGVHKAILAGYTYNSTLSSAQQNSSLLLQYDLDAHALDSSFGGFNGNAAGIAFGDGKKINVIGQQSTGRIIAGGLSKDTSPLGLLLGYTAAGKLDTSFGNGGYQSTSSVVGSTGIYTHAIDTQNRILIAYNNGSNNVAVSRVLADGSGLDTTGFGTGGSVTSQITGISGNTNMRVAVSSSNQVIVAAVLSSGVAITIKRYTSAGVIDATLALTSSDLGTLTSFTLSRLLVDTNGQVIVVGYDNAATDQIVVFRTLADLSALDAAFNPTPGTPGYLKYGVAATTTQVSTDALIHPDGRIIVVGSEL